MEELKFLGTITVRKNYPGDVTIPNVPGIDDEGNHDDWTTTFEFSNKEDLLNLIKASKREWFDGYKFPLKIEDNSVSYTGKRAELISQIMMPTTEHNGCRGIDTLISWVCDFINLIPDDKVIIITEE